MIEIFGAKGNIQNVDRFVELVQIFAKDNNLTIQSFNAELIFGKNHLISAVEHALRAMKDKTNTTNSLEMEIMLYASGERQLKLAIPKMGITTGKNEIAFVLLNKKGKISNKIVESFLTELKLVRYDNALDGDGKTLKKFGISRTEIDTIIKDKYGDLILEKVAMVDIIK